MAVCYHVFLIMPVAGAGPGLTEGFNDTVGLVLLSETQFVLVNVNTWHILIVTPIHCLILRLMFNWNLI